MVAAANVIRATPYIPIPSGRSQASVATIATFRGAGRIGSADSLLRAIEPPACPYPEFTPALSASLDRTLKLKHSNLLVIAEQRGTTADVLKNLKFRISRLTPLLARPM